MSNRQPSRKLTREDAAVIKKLLEQKVFQNRIAAEFDVNPGRTFADVHAAN